MGNDSRWTWDGTAEPKHNPYEEGQRYGAGAQTPASQPGTQQVAGTPDPASQPPAPPQAAQEQTTKQQVISTPAPNSWDVTSWQAATKPAGEEGQSYAPHDTGANAAPSFDYRPGIIALRPLSFGEFFDGAFRAIQHNPRVMFGMSLIVGASVAAFQFIILRIFAAELNAQTARPTALIGSASLDTVAFVLALSFIVSGAASLVLTGLLIGSVSQSVIGQRAAFRQLLRDSKLQLLRLFGLTFVLGVLLMLSLVVSFMVTGFVLVPLQSAARFDSLAFVGLGLILFALLVIWPVIYVVTRLALSSAVLIMEQCSIFRSIRRSWFLSGGFVGRNAGLLLLSFVVTSLLMAGIGLPFAAFGSLFQNLPPSLYWISSALPVAVSTVVMALVTPFFAALLALMYVDVRMRKEGLDVELIRSAGSRL